MLLSTNLIDPFLYMCLNYIVYHSYYTVSDTKLIDKRKV